MSIKVEVRPTRTGGRQVVVTVPIDDCIPTALSPVTAEQIALEVAMHAIADILERGGAR